MTYFWLFLCLNRVRLILNAFSHVPKTMVVACANKLLTEFLHTQIMDSKAVPMAVEIILTRWWEFFVTFRFTKRFTSTGKVNWESVRKNGLSSTDLDHSFNKLKQSKFLTLEYRLRTPAQAFKNYENTRMNIFHERAFKRLGKGVWIGNWVKSVIT